MELLKKLCDIDSSSGEECYIREFIIKQISGHCDYYIDKIGNLICFKKGKKTLSEKIVYSAHMDEVGFMVEKIEDDGTLCMGSIGVSPSVVGGKSIRIRSTINPEKPKWINGVFGLGPIHTLAKEKLSEVPSFRDLRLDIGVSSKKEAEKLVVPGDYGYFLNNFGNFGNFIKSKALDDRIGCYILIQMILSELEYDSWFVFCVMEEIGCKGSSAAAFELKPDIAFVIEGTTAADIDGTDENSKVCFLGKGPVISFADRGTMYDIDYVHKLTNVADKSEIPWQFKSFVAGGNDARSYQRVAGGCKVLSISAAVRYLHSQISVASFDDVKNIFSLCCAVDKNIIDFVSEVKHETENS